MAALAVPGRPARADPLTSGAEEESSADPQFAGAGRELPGVGPFVARERPEVVAEVVARRLSSPGPEAG